MSGCVNCVWDIFRDDMEEWAAASREAGRRLKEQERGVMGVGMSMDDDGGGSEMNWDRMEGAGSEEELFGNIPVGIREFMRTEKRLKQNRLRNAGG
jgi:Oxidoreductase-like protein, N-terminal